MTPRVVTASAPARVDLAGGWTDVAPYTTEVGGAVCNVAIELRAVASVQAGRAEPAPPSEALLRAAWERAAMPNVAIGLTSAVPIGSGLGGSSAAGVALAAAIATWREQALSLQELAELSRLTESETMGLAGGCQDHYAAAFGGALLLRCGTQTDVERIAMSESAVTMFERRTMIAFTGESRMSARTITAVLDAYRANDSKTCDALARMVTLAPLMAAALAVGDLDRLGQLLADQWRAQRALHPTISTPLIDRIVSDVAAAGALGTKALGASGGGCVLVIAGEGREDAVRTALRERAQLLPLEVARQGVQVHVTNGSD